MIRLRSSCGRGCMRNVGTQVRRIVATIIVVISVLDASDSINHWRSAPDGSIHPVMPSPSDRLQSSNAVLYRKRCESGMTVNGDKLSPNTACEGENCMDLSTVRSPNEGDDNDDQCNGTGSDNECEDGTTSSGKNKFCIDEAESITEKADEAFMNLARMLDLARTAHFIVETETTAAVSDDADASRGTNDAPTNQDNVDRSNSNSNSHRRPATKVKIPVAREFRGDPNWTMDIPKLLFCEPPTENTIFDDLPGISDRYDMNQVQESDLTSTVFPITTAYNIEILRTLPLTSLISNNEAIRDRLEERKGTSEQYSAVGQLYRLRGNTSVRRVWCRRTDEDTEPPTCLPVCVSACLCRVQVKLCCIMHARAGASLEMRALS
eukprot:m.461995 g.461995  ORF g.461995 m.461995 type:complete len:379 (+) comp21601_c1_seq2:193-1329(+)